MNIRTYAEYFTTTSTPIQISLADSFGQNSPANTVIVDNYTNQYLYFPVLNKYIQPLTTGVQLPLPQPAGSLILTWQSPSIELPYGGYDVYNNSPVIITVTSQSLSMSGGTPISDATHGTTGKLLVTYTEADFTYNSVTGQFTLNTNNYVPLHAWTQSVEVAITLSFAGDDVVFTNADYSITLTAPIQSAPAPQPIVYTGNSVGHMNVIPDAGYTLVVNANSSTDTFTINIYEVYYPSSISIHNQPSDQIPILVFPNPAYDANGLTTASSLTGNWAAGTWFYKTISIFEWTVTCLNLALTTQFSFIISDESGNSMTLSVLVFPDSAGTLTLTSRLNFIPYALNIKNAISSSISSGFTLEVMSGTPSSAYTTSLNMYP